MALASPLTIPLQGQKLLDQVLRESAGKRIQKKSPKPSGNLQPVNTRDSEATGPKWVQTSRTSTAAGKKKKKKLIVNLLNVRPL